MSRKNSSACYLLCRSACGARTRACRVHTRVNAFAPSRICTRPRIVFNSRNQASLHWIPLNVPGDLTPFSFITNVMIVRLALPKLLARAMQQPISLPSRDALQRFQQQARRDPRQQKHVNMIGHDHERPEMILSQILAAKQRLDYQRGHRFASQTHRTGVRSIQVPIHPHKSFTIRDFAGWWKMRARQASVQIPGQEEPTVVGVQVGEAALGGHALNSGALPKKLSRSHECERCTQECVRYI